MTFTNILDTNKLLFTYKSSSLFFHQDHEGFVETPILQEGHLTNSLNWKNQENILLPIPFSESVK